jgi:hypothetical protein
MRHDSAGALVLAGILVLAAAPAHAQEDGDPASQATQIPLESASGRPDLYLDMPYFLGGFEPEIVMTRGEEHIAGLGPEDRTRQEIEGLLDTVGAEIDDMVSGYALVSQEDFFSFVVAIRIDGIEPGTLLSAYLPMLYDDLDDAQGIDGRIGDKDVVIISSVGDDGEYVDLHVYDEGDTIWMLQGPGDVIETTLSNLPEPQPGRD